MTLPRPAAELHEHAASSARLRSNRLHVSAWLRALNLSTIEQLFEAVAGRNTEATALLLSENRRGVPLASTVLIGAKVVMLNAVARHAPGDSLDERFQATLDAFFCHALPRVHPTHKYADAQLYWITLRTVTRQHERGPIVVDPTVDRALVDAAGADVAADIDGYLTVEFLLEWALETGVIADLEHRALTIRFGGSTVLPVREVAARLGVSEDKLESRLRRATVRLQQAVSENRDSLECACVQSRWGASEGAAPAGISADADKIEVAA